MSAGQPELVALGEADGGGLGDCVAGWVAVGVGPGGLDGAAVGVGVAVAEGDALAEADGVAEGLCAAEWLRVPGVDTVCGSAGPLGMMPAGMACPE